MLDPHPPIVLSIDDSTVRAICASQITWDDTSLSGTLAASIFSSSGCLSNISETFRREGYVWVRLEQNTTANKLAPIVVTAIAASAGTTIRVYDWLDTLWRRFEVDLTRPGDRSGGAGFQPLHIDFVNASRPPDRTVIFCERRDPLNGGQTILAKFDGIEDKIGSTARNHLSRRLYFDGTLTRLTNVGHDINPFAVISSDDWLPYRYSGQLLKAALGSEEKDAIVEFSHYLSVNSIIVPLLANDFLILDQHRIAHGRAALGDGQMHLAPSDRRLLRIAFLRKHRS